MINIRNEQLLAVSKVPNWTEKQLGKRIAPSTIWRWFYRGCRGVKLDTILIGGRRYTSVEALDRFFNAATSSQVGCNSAHSSSRANSTPSQASRFLDSEGI